MKLYTDELSHAPVVMVSRSYGSSYIPENGLAVAFAGFRQSSTLSARDIEYIEEKFGMKVQIVAPANGRGIIREVNKMEAV